MEKAIVSEVFTSQEKAFQKSCDGGIRSLAAAVKAFGKGKILRRLPICSLKGDV